MNYLIMAGGTGGHVFPGLSIAQALIDRGHTVFWLGAIGGMEESLVKEYAIKMFLVPISSLRGKSVWNKLVVPFKLIKSVWLVRKIMKSNDIDLAISMGGYVAAPGGMATRFCQTKLLVHEQNSIFGLTNRTLAKWANKVLTGFDLNHLYNSEWVGNPVRIEIESKKYQYRTQRPIRVLILGGSLGAKTLNTLLPEYLMKEVSAGLFDLKHQCGKGNLGVTQKAYGETSQYVEISEFIEDMGTAYEWADFCICRAGAMTVAEVAAVGVPAIMIPYPYAVDNHQYHNAKKVKDAGAGFIWLESEKLTVFEDYVKRIQDDEQRGHMAMAMQKLGKQNVAVRIAKLCEGLVE